MSAYVVGKVHIDALLTAGLRLGYGGPAGSGEQLRWWRRNPREIRDTLTAEQNYFDELNRGRRSLDYTNADEVGDMLVRENVRSVMHRYPDGGVDDLPGPNDAYWAAPYRLDELPGRPDPLLVLKALDCYEYQSCEHDEWEESEASSFCEALRHLAIRHLPGYDDAPGWEVRDRAVFLAREAARR